VCFLFNAFVEGTRGCDVRIDLGIEEGVLGSLTSGIDRYDEETCEGEKPRTMLVVLRSETPLAAEEADAAGDGLSKVEFVDAVSLSATAGAIMVGVTVRSAGVTACAGSGVGGARYE